MRDEIDTMARNNTWYESELSRGRKVETSRWIFTIQSLINGKFEKTHIRTCCKRSFTQTDRKDYLDTFAPMTKLHRILIVLSLATKLERDLWQRDVKNAFLQGELEDDVYMHPLHGLEHLVKPENVLRLKKISTVSNNLLEPVTTTCAQFSTKEALSINSTILSSLFLHHQVLFFFLFMLIIS